MIILELGVKHLAPYLPYELEFLMESEPESKEPNIGEMHSIHTKLKSVKFDAFNNRQLKEIKPLLKSISQLDDYLAEALGCQSEGHQRYDWVLDLFCVESIGTNKKLNDIDLKTLPYNCVEFLFKHHYDFFGLIENGLAIEKNKNIPNSHIMIVTN